MQTYKAESNVHEDPENVSGVDLTPCATGLLARQEAITKQRARAQTESLVVMDLMGAQGRELASLQARVGEGPLLAWLQEQCPSVAKERVACVGVAHALEARDMQAAFRFALVNPEARALPAPNGSVVRDQCLSAFAKIDQLLKSIDWPVWWERLTEPERATMRQAKERLRPMLDLIQ